ncbi:hypothetical protein SeMB42_g03744 [Synchytrium endobioticum]|uniref:Maleylacetoacetate isomerase n=1 Tax=Synchytrium endobioticum TaxID=286115 RepID=A0A507D4E3_9FUNG|nr:hypothetical protein SeMB42_g03744 [Synchytrium endobioticum]
MAPPRKKPFLYSYWRSSASWRVRIGLALKEIEYEYVPVNLVKGEQLGPEFMELNPAKLVPLLIWDDKHLTQSPAILELLDELYPEIHPFLPADPYAKATVRSIVDAIVCDTHPVANSRILKLVGGDDDAKRAEYAKVVITWGMEAVEAQLRKTAGKYSYGDALTMADIVLAPQFYNVYRWKCDVTTVSRGMSSRLVGLPL